MNQADELSKTKFEFAIVEAELEKCKVSEQKLQELFDSLHSSQTTSPETSPKMYLKTDQVKKEVKPEEKRNLFFMIDLYLLDLSNPRFQRLKQKTSEEVRQSGEEQEQQIPGKQEEQICIT
ncbi:hypothetical protein QVD17_12305 [Tagetes erecta]|uniref:Uncharacterized protein n=1 Tax=Tagetes erecta TaxID=13708 RepID=A0AAD8NVK9_TARER|nr:hypothetical protein QVD17_12305 [Tagetes erecta]